jgi:Zn-dependent alcohol dehydrogenase
VSLISHGIYARPVQVEDVNTKMPTSARIAVLRKGTPDLVVEDVELPDPGPDQVIVRNVGAGICHSQLHELRAERSTTYLLGHESSGIVEAVGPGVEHVGPGDDVAVTWVPRHDGGRPWSAGAELRNGEYASTAEMVFTWGTHSLVDKRYVVPIPQGTASDVAAILGCAVMTGAGAVVRTAQVPQGASIAVWGAGGVGLSAIAAAHLTGAATIIAVDVSAEKLELACRFGATHTVNTTSVDAVEAIRTITSRPEGAAGADYVFDCVASQATLDAALSAVRKGVLGASQGGRLLIVGVPSPGLGVDPREILIGQKTVTASLGGSAIPDIEIPRFAEWSRRGDLDLELLVTNRYELDDINRGISDLMGGRIRGRAILTF